MWGALGLGLLGLCIKMALGYSPTNQLLSHRTYSEMGLENFVGVSYPEGRLPCLLEA